MAAARSPPLSEPAKVQLWRPTAMPRSARSAAWLERRVRPAGRLDDWARLAVGRVEPVEAGIGIGLHQAGIARQVTLGMLAAAVARVEEGGRGRIGSGEGPIVAHIGPEAPGSGLALGQ